jgi:hypothetical protein
VLANCLEWHVRPTHTPIPFDDDDKGAATINYDGGRPGTRIAAV